MKHKLNFDSFRQWELTVWKRQQLDIENKSLVLNLSITAKSMTRFCLNFQAPSRDDKINTHFIAFVCKQDGLYELGK